MRLSFQKVEAKQRNVSTAITLSVYAKAAFSLAKIVFILKLLFASFVYKSCHFLFLNHTSLSLLYIDPKIKMASIVFPILSRNPKNPSHATQEIRHWKTGHVT